ncbi:MAG: DUF7557 family protein [Candidatus Helarchaeota archaeon]
MTTIHVKIETWKKLNGLKKPGETMNDVIQKLLEIFEDIQDAQKNLDDIDQESFDNLLDDFCSIADEEIQKVILNSKKGFQKEITGKL